MNNIKSPFSARRKRFSPWRYGLKLGLAVAMIVWWWLQNQRQDDVKISESRVVLPPDESKPKEALKTVTKSEASAATPDDLTQIEGVGPKYAAVLQEAGVISYAQLAKMKPGDIQDIFRAATGRAPNPSDWIKQAAKLSK